MLDTAPAASPFTPDQLAGALAPFGQSVMLPREAYTSERVLAFELERFFTDSWVCVGRDEELAAGGQRAVRVGGIGVLLVRGLDGRLRAFANVCRHRGHELLETGAATTRRTILCPYHAWTYDLDGSLRVAPGFRCLAPGSAAPWSSRTTPSPCRWTAAAAACPSPAWTASSCAASSTSGCCRTCCSACTPT